MCFFDLIKRSCSYISDLFPFPEVTFLVMCGGNELYNLLDEGGIVGRMFLGVFSCTLCSGDPPFVHLFLFFLVLLLHLPAFPLITAWSIPLTTLYMPHNYITSVSKGMDSNLCNQSNLVLLFGSISSWMQAVMG